MTRKQLSSKIWYIKNQVLTKARAADWAANNKDARQRIRKKWRDANLTKARNIEKISAKKRRAAITEYQKDYRRSNPGLSASYCAARRSALLQRTPKWLSNTQLAEISEFYIISKELQWLSSEPLQVDHIVPLQGENVSGLHVPWNLQILPRSDNCKKSNKI